jgi:4a-hydroxytetrahydrobiopterin dehydratase
MRKNRASSRVSGFTIETLERRVRTLPTKIGVPSSIMTEQLADRKCVPCRGGIPALKGTDLRKFHDSVPDWVVVDEHHLNRQFTFSDFKQALDFVNRVGAVAEQEGHHPDIFLAWGKAEITLWTHKIDGLTESDFIMAAKIDRLSKTKS